MVSWQFLIVGSFAALGAAMAAGTLAALLRYRRTGTFPNQDPDVPAEPLTQRQIVGLWVRIAVGATLAAAGVVALITSGLI